MGMYQCDASRAASASLAIGSVVSDSTTPRRLKCHAFSAGFTSAPADNQYEIVMGRISAAGTSTAFTPHAYDAADAAALFDGGENHTVDATFTAGSDLKRLGLNHRATYEWRAQPGRELVGPATAANGFGWKTVTAPSTGTIVVSAEIEEL